MTSSRIVSEQLSPASAEVVRATLPLVGSRIDEIAPTFYRRMFAAEPGLLRDTFNRGNQARGAQQKALAASVATFATLLVDPDGPSPDEMLARIGHKHVSLGITEDQYRTVHTHLFAAIVEVLTPEVVTAEVAAAWDEVYWIMARSLVRFEAARYDEMGVEPGDVFRVARVARRTDHSAGVASFELLARDGEPALPAFRAGQYVSVRRTMADGARQLRQYSLDNAPAGGTWRITVKRVVDPVVGEVSASILDGLHVGDELEVSLPTGDLVLDESSATPVVLVSAGIGATPMLGMARALAAAGSEREVVVLHADHDAADAALARELDEVAASLPNGRSHQWFSVGSSDAQLAGRMDLSYVDLPEGAEFYLCGSNVFLLALREQLREAGVPDERVHYELFAPNDWLLPG